MKAVKLFRWIEVSSILTRPLMKENYSWSLSMFTENNRICLILLCIIV